MIKTRTVTVTIESLSAYSQSRFLSEQRGKSEEWNAFEERIWPERAHYTADGNVFIPQFALKQAIDSASKWLGKIKGKGNATWTKHFIGGVVVTESVVLPIKRADLASVWIAAHSDGKRGSGSRVPRCFPIIPTWGGSFKCMILSEEITKEAFAEALEIAGTLVGIGRFRPENGGLNGRFSVKKIEWA